MKIYVGKLSTEITEKELENLFKPYGHITSIYIRKDHNHGVDFRYGLIEMPVKKQALVAIEALNGRQENGTELSVHLARIGPKDRRRSERDGGRRSYDPLEEEK
jgi:RNA recognition motif-containing protein